VPTLAERSSRLPVVGPLLVAGVGLALVAYRDLLRFEPRLAIDDPVERVLFEPAETTPAVVIALALWLLWRRRERWSALPSRPGPVALSVGSLALAAAILVWSRLSWADDLLALSLIAALIGLASLAKGLPGVRLVALPAAFLLFALPLPPAFANAVIFRFQIWTAELAGQLLFLFGSPAHVAGATILRADFTFSVIEACSGLRSVMTLSMLAVMMVDLFRRRGWHAWIVVLAAPVVAFALNAVRAIALIVNPHSEITAVHAAQGIAILLSGLVVLYALDGVLARLLPDRPDAALTSARGENASPDGVRRALALAFLGGLALASLVVPRWIVIDTPPLRIEARYQQRIGEWVGEPLEIDRLFLGSVFFRESLSGRYRLGDDTIDLFIGVGDRARRFLSSLSPKTELLGGAWEIEQRWPLDGEAGGPAARRMLLRSGTRWVLAEHWTRASDGVASEALRSLLTLDATPWRRSQDPVIIRIATPLRDPDEVEAAQARLERFRRSLGPELDRLMLEMERLSQDARRKGFS
jgi:exosortase